MQLVYVSTAHEELAPQVLDAILVSSVKHNMPQQITGMLVYADGNFLQILEGAAAAVQETFDRVKDDSRHYGVLVIAHEPVEHREFQQWSMGFRRVTRDELTANPAYAPLIAGKINFSALGVRPGLAMEILRDFSAR
jgi:hypothetical protein